MGSCCQSSQVQDNEGQMKFLENYSPVDFQTQSQPIQTKNEQYIDNVSSQEQQEEQSMIKKKKSSGDSQLDNISKIHLDTNTHPHDKQETKINKEYIALKEYLLNKKQRKIELNNNIDLLDIDLRKREIPICIDGCNCQIFDMSDLFIQKEISCDKCKRVGRQDEENICIESQYYQFRQKICPKSYSCSFILNKYILHSYSRYQPYAVELLNNKLNQQFLDKIINQSGDFDFMSLLQYQESQNLRDFRTIPILSIQCLYNANKIKIAVRLRDCKHLECYEYTSILELIDKNNRKPESFRLSTVNCFSIGCDAKLPLNFSDLENVLIFDKRITESINQASDFAIKLEFQPQTNGFVDPFVEFQSNDLARQIIETMNQSYPLQRLMANCVNRELDYQQQCLLEFSNYQIKDEIQQKKFQTQFPTRCIKCNLEQYGDLCHFVFQYVKQKKEKSGVFKCPVCEFTHQNVKKITYIIYFDKYFAQNLYRTKNTSQYNGDAKLNLLFKQTQWLDENNIMKQYRLDLQIPYKDYRSCKSKNKLNVPLVLLKCKNNSYIEYSELVDFLKYNQYSLEKLKCCECCSNLKIVDFYFDYCLAKILKKLQTDLNYWDKNVNYIIRKMNKQQDGKFKIPEKCIKFLGVQQSSQNQLNLKKLQFSAGKV